MAVIDFSTTTLAAGAALLLLAIFALRPRRTFSAPLPPSPKGLPLVGHTHLLSGCKYSWVTFLDIFRSLPKQEQSAGVMYLRLGTSDCLVISTCKAAQDLLEKKSAIYSGELEYSVPSSIAQELILGSRRPAQTAPA